MHPYGIGFTVSPYPDIPWYTLWHTDFFFSSWKTGIWKVSLSFFLFSQRVFFWKTPTFCTENAVIPFECFTCGFGVSKCLLTRPLHVFRVVSGRESLQIKRQSTNYQIHCGNLTYQWKIDLLWRYVLLKKCLYRFSIAMLVCWRVSCLFGAVFMGAPRWQISQQVKVTSKWIYLFIYIYGHPPPRSTYLIF